METSATRKYIVLDTNCMFRVIKTPDYRSVEYDADLIGLWERIDANGAKDTYVFLIPELCIREFVTRKTAEILDKAKEMGRLQECFSRYGMLLREAELLSADSFSAAYRKMLLDDLTKNGFRSIPVCPADYFHTIVDDAVAKRPPFEGKEKQSDKGFKDTVIWYSLLDYAGSNAGEYYLVSNDGMFHTARNYFQDAIQKKTQASVQIIHSLTEVNVVQSGAQPAAARAFLQYRVLEREQMICALNGRAVLKVNYQWPEILSDGQSCDKIKDDLGRLLARKAERWNSIAAAYKNEQIYGADYLSDEVTFDLRCNKDGIFSFTLYSYLYLGGAHGTPTLEGYTYDLHTGNRLDIKDLWQGSEEAFFETLKNKIQEYYDSTKKKYGQRTCEKLPYNSMDQAQFYVDDRGLIVHFGAYEIGCYAEGLVEVVMQDQIKTVSE